MRRLLTVFVLGFLCQTCFAQLTILNPRLREYDSGPFVASSSVFHPRDRVFLSFQVSGFKLIGEEEDQVSLTWESRTTDPAGRLVAAPKSGKIDVSIAPEDKKTKWLPRVNYEVQIPDAGAGGTYTVHLAVHDVNGNADTTAEFPLTVAGPAGDAAPEALTADGFTFLRSEQASDALPEGGSYRPGDTVWATFRITGYKFSPSKNKFDVAYGLALSDSEGKVLFSEPKAAEQSEESFYPRQFVPAILNLKLDRKIKPGVYTLSLHIVDRIGNQEIDLARNFRVE